MKSPLDRSFSISPRAIGNPPCERIHNSNCSSVIPMVTGCDGTSRLEGFFPAANVVGMACFELLKSVFVN